MSDYSEWEKAAQSFESSLMILRKDKNGWVIGFSVHPEEAPTALLDAPLGTRFRAVLFQIGDDESPVPVGKKERGFEISESETDPVTQSGKMCRDPEFQEWMLSTPWMLDDRQNWFEEDGPEIPEGILEADTAQELRRICKIKSRREFGTNKEARKRFEELCSEFRSYQMEI